MADSQHPNPNQWWFHRRLMAYLSIMGLYLVTGSMLLGCIQAAMVPLAQTLCYVFSANLLYYYGGNAVEYLKSEP